MDNTLKLIIGVLSLSGLIVLLVPDRDPNAPAPAAEAVAVASTPPEAVAEEATDEEAEEGEVDDEPELEFKFGEPMMDGRPIDPIAGEDAGFSSGANQSPSEAPQPVNVGSNNVANQPIILNGGGGGLPPPAPLPAGMITN